MAEVHRYFRTLAAALAAFALLGLAPAKAEDRKPKTDLYEGPVLAVDPGMHTATLRAQAVDEEGRYAVTGGADHTVRVWSLADGKLLRTIWIPVGPEYVGVVYAVAISPDGSTIAVGGYSERRHGDHPIYIFDRASGDLVRRIFGDLPDVTHFLTFSPDGRYLAATLGAGDGLRIFDRKKDWSAAFEDDQYGGDSYRADFARDGRLVTTSYDGLIRRYSFDPRSDNPNFRRAGEPVKAPDGRNPRGVVFSPDGERVAIGYNDVPVVDVLDSTTLKRLGEQRPANVTIGSAGLPNIAWSRDGRTLFAAGAVRDEKSRFLLFAWDQNGLGYERRMTYCAADTATDINPLRDGRLLVASFSGCIGLMGANGEKVWTNFRPVADFRDQFFKASSDASVVDFSLRDPTSPNVASEATLRFDIRALALSSPPPEDNLTGGPRPDGLKVDGWRNGTAPTLDGKPLPFTKYDTARSLAIDSNAKRFYLGSSFALAAFDETGAPKWRWRSPSEIWAVNASGDGRLVVTADHGGAVRWRRADDGRELLALQVLRNSNKPPAEWDWVLWTPEGFYHATPGAEDVLKWVVNHGPDQAASTLPVSAIAKLHRPDALKRILDQLETARALGLDDLDAARVDVQRETGSLKPPGGVLHVLAIGVDHFGDKAGGLHLDYAASDARDVATALLNSQKGGPNKPGLYADVELTTLTNEKADGAAILDALENTAGSMAKSAGQDLTVILVSSHGEIIDNQFYLIPFGFDLGSRGKSIKTAVSATEFGDRLKNLAAHGKVLVLLDTCHSGAIGAQPWAKDPEAKMLQDALDQANVTVLTSSKLNEKSEELPEWKHGALTQAFLDALVGAADTKGIVTVSGLEDAMENEIAKLTHDRQHLGMHRNFSGDLFVAAGLH